MLIAILASRKTTRCLSLKARKAMFPELFADLRGSLGYVPNYFRNPFLVYAAILGIYLIWRRIGKT